MSGRCEAIVYRRDTYRRCGGRLHFRMYYAPGQCLRRAVINGFCGQHSRIAADHPNYIHRAVSTDVTTSEKPVS